ncbi:thiamine phosphate synthase [Terriglobus aquaticus]|uniref:Thiamine-phosphate synthase n=1 Tax=Terriglobus aquaticus TaxID=940139 RepID=A0ABW9KMW7_9BACT|nr:thiamine phosphate synthase [Terriglobus aquaticus]
MSPHDLTTIRTRFARAIAAHEPSLRLYAILDRETCARRNLDIRDVAVAWLGAGVRLVQYRDKLAGDDDLLRNARDLRAIFPRDEAFLILNDRPDLVEACDFDGAHIGQTDQEVQQARDLLGPQRLLGVSTHSADQALLQRNSDVDYVAIGPVFATSTKADADPVVGLCGVQAARAVMPGPLVAIGGIGLGDARAVEMAGADSVAVISALLPGSDLDGVTGRAQDFLARLK